MANLPAPCSSLLALMSPRFLAFMPFIFKWEGEAYENDPDDPGGATKYGIDQRSHPQVNIRDLTKAQASEIYWHEYWQKVLADALPSDVGEVMMDIAVNNGRGRAIRWLQQLAGVTADGALGPNTLKAAMIKGPSLAFDLLSRREAFYHEIATGKLRKFLKGWLNRNHDLRRLIMAG